MGAHQAAAIGEHGVQLQQFQGGERKALPKGGHRRLDWLAHEVAPVFQFPGHRSRQVGVGGGIDAQGLEPAPELLPLHMGHRLNHAYVAGNLQHGGEVNHPVRPAVVVENWPAADA